MFSAKGRIPFYPGFSVFLSFKIAPTVSKYAKGWTDMELFRFPARKCISLYSKGFKPTLGPTLRFIQGVRGLKRPNVHLLSCVFTLPCAFSPCTDNFTLTFNILCCDIYVILDRMTEDTNLKFRKYENVCICAKIWPFLYPTCVRQFFNVFLASFARDVDNKTCNIRIT